MTRILLVVAVVAAITAVLWSSWRINRRLFLGVAGLVVLGLVLLASGVFQTDEKAWNPIDPDRLALEVTRWNIIEGGVRIEGLVTNTSDQSLARLHGHAALLECTGEADCREVAAAPLEIRLHVPPGERYPFDTVLRTGPLDSPETPRWLLRIDRAEAYTPKQRLTE